MGVATHRPHRKRCFANTATELREGSLSVVTAGYVDRRGRATPPRSCKNAYWARGEGGRRTPCAETMANNNRCSASRARSQSRCSTSARTLVRSPGRCCTAVCTRRALLRKWRRSASVAPSRASVASWVPRSTRSTPTVTRGQRCVRPRARSTSPRQRKLRRLVRLSARPTGRRLVPTLPWPASRPSLRPVAAVV